MCWGFLKGKGGKKGVGEKRRLTDDELRALFKKYDGNGDGHLDKSELTEAFKELGCLLPGRRASQAIQQNDLDLDGDIDENEIDHLISYVRIQGL